MDTESILDKIAAKADAEAAEEEKRRLAARECREENEGEYGCDEFDELFEGA